MINRTVLVGRLTADPTLRYTANGIAVASFTLACNSPFKNAQGNQEADFINVTVWKKAAENVANYLKKGSLAGVDGRIQTRNYDKDDGTKVFVTEVVADSVQFLEPKNSGQAQSNNEQQSNQQTENKKGPLNPDDPFGNDGKPIDINDDDLPF